MLTHTLGVGEDVNTHTLGVRGGVNTHFISEEV